MKFFAPCLVVFALLTDPQGHAIYVASDQIVAITEPQKYDCTADSHAKLITTAGALCIAEDTADARRKLESQDGH